jgi:hypothetical protein
MHKIFLVLATFIMTTSATAGLLTGTVTKVFEMGEGDHTVLVRIQEKNKSKPTLLLLRDSHSRFVALHAFLKSAEDKYIQKSNSTEIKFTVKPMASSLAIEDATGN